MSDERLLVLDELACSRGGLVILAGVSLALSAGDVVVLRGPNGSGKTTLLRTVAGLQPPAAGGIDAAPDSIAYAAHLDGIKGTLTVAENLEFWAGLHGVQQIDVALDAFDLQGLRNRRAQALSAGQKRRLGLARLLVTERPIWVLDEPTVSLDTLSVGLFSDAVSLHLHNGGAALIATHIELGLQAREIDVSVFRPGDTQPRTFEDAFL